MATKGSKSKRKTRKTYKFEIAPLSMALWAFGLFFLLAWIFALGIFVGRGFLPGAVTALSDLKGQIRKLQEMVIDDTERGSASIKGSESDPKLAFYEKLSSKREEAKKQWHPKKEAVTAQKETVKPVPKPPARKLIKKDRENPPKTARNDTQYTVQLASLKDRAGAQKMIKQLVDRGYKAYYSTAVVKGKTYYRINCGKFGSREEAAMHSVRLGKEAGLKGYVSKVK